MIIATPYLMMDGVDNDNDGTFLNNFNSNFQPCDPYGSVMQSFHPYW